MAKAAGGDFLLRIEDIDQSRARPEWEQAIFEDLRWLGLDWPNPVMRQSDRLSSYRTALDQLWEDGLLYACTCHRRDILAASNAPQEGAPLMGPDGIIYPGTCRHKNLPREAGALRLDMRKAATRLPEMITFSNNADIIEIHMKDVISNVGDVVLARRDMGTSYHLSVVVDDAAQAITHVTRGEDLFDATQIHVVLQQLLGFPVPHYHHHRLIRDDQGKRLAKRDDARAISQYRTAGATPKDVKKMIEL